MSMTQNHQKNIGEALILIHKLISRSLKVIGDQGRSFARSGFGKEDVKDGFINYVRTFVTVVETHHQTEEELAFPYFRKLLPTAPYDALTSDHQLIKAMLEAIGAAADGLAAGRAGSIDRLNEAVSLLDKKWHPHISIEESNFSVDVTRSLLPVEEHEQFLKTIADFNQQHSNPPYLVIPFVLFNLEQEDREAMSEDLPEAITKGLVPGPWKEKWAPMQPFLLP
jgi:hemerythrin-like domain-containing protein